jgi:hypothetical protein
LFPTTCAIRRLRIAAVPTEQPHCRNDDPASDDGCGGVQAGQAGQAG